MNHSSISELEQGCATLVHETEHFDVKALTAITDIVDRLRKSKIDGCLGPQVDWLNGILSPP